MYGHHFHILNVPGGHFVDMVFTKIAQNRLKIWFQWNYVVGCSHDRTFHIPSSLCSYYSVWMPFSYFDRSRGKFLAINFTKIAQNHLENFISVELCGSMLERSPISYSKLSFSYYSVWTPFSYWDSSRGTLCGHRLHQNSSKSPRKLDISGIMYKYA